MVTVRRAHSAFVFALEGLGTYLNDPAGDDAHQDWSYLSKPVEKALSRLQAARELLHVPDDDEPSADLLAALEDGRDAVIAVESDTGAKEHARAAI